VFERPDPATLEKVFGIRRHLLAARRAIWPMRESVGSLYRDPHDHVGEETRVYLRDCHDHVVQLIDLVETHRELASGLMDLYLSSISNRMNEVMKVLTIIATIFIPVTFIAGIYGMNFENMPELEWAAGYPLVLSLTAIAVALLYRQFKKSGWL